METIPYDVLGNVYGFLNPKAVLLSLCVNHTWRDCGADIYGEKILELQKALRSVVQRISNGSLVKFLASVVYLETSDFCEILERVKDTDVKIMTAALHLFTPKKLYNEEQFLIDSKTVLNDDCCKFFEDIIEHGYNTIPGRCMRVDYSMDIKNRFVFLLGVTKNINSRVFHTLFLDYLRRCAVQDCNTNRSGCIVLIEILDRVFRYPRDGVAETLIMSHNWEKQKFLKFLKVYILLSAEL
jgi:hypothetical protein